MKAVLFLIFAIFFISFADELIIAKKDGLSFYTQEAEFLIAKGDSVVGPINLLPFADTDSIVIENKNPNFSVLTYIIEPVFKNWKKNIIGKNISYEGSGRIIKGIVRSISDRFITIETKRGVIITTLPEFPSKLSSHFSWKEFYSPKITLRVNSNISDSVKIYFKYPLKNIYWKPYYVLKINGKKGKLISFYSIRNFTQNYFNNIHLKIKTDKKIIEINSKTSLPPLVEKRIKMHNPKIINFKDGVFVGNKFPNGKVIILKNNMVLSYGKIVNGYLKLGK